MFSDKCFRRVTWESCSLMSANQSQSEGKKSSGGLLQDRIQEAPGQALGFQCSELATGSSRWALEPLRNWPSFRNSEASSRAQPVGIRSLVPECSERPFGKNKKPSEQGRCCLGLEARGSRAGGLCGESAAL